MDTAKVIKKLNETPLRPITRAEFDYIAPGMRYPSVVKTFGREGIKMNMSMEEMMALKGVEGRIYSGRRYRTFEVYAWKNTKGDATGDDPRIFIAFVDGGMAAKYQYGLE